MEDLLETHNFYKKLFKAFEALPLGDMVFALNSATSNMLGNGDYEGFRLFVTRVKSYSERSKLSSEKQASVAEFLSVAEPIAISFYAYPELRPILRKEDWMTLRCRFFALLFGDSTANDAAVWASANYCTMEELEQDAPLPTDEKIKISLKAVKEKLALLESQGVGGTATSGVLIQQYNTDLLDSPKLVSPPVLSLDERILGDDFNDKKTDELALSIAALCLDPFMESDMNLLLFHLGAIKESDRLGEERKFKVVSPLNGKAKGVISAFPAAYGVLSRAGLFSIDKDKWSAATLTSYNQELGRKVLNYEPGALKNEGNGSGAFDKYTKQSERWLHDWQTKRTSQNDS